jgi:DUF4097 and DUF4098 domain-containing protein YvlB
MLLTLLVASLAVAAPQQSDTTITVTPGTRLEMDNPGGEIIVHGWERNAVQIKARHSARTHVQIKTAGTVLSIESEADRGPANIVDYDISVPSWMPLKLEGMYSDISIENMKADAELESLNGNLTVKNVTGSLNLHSVQGTISVNGSRGRLELNSVSEGVIVLDAEGDITVETISGDVDLQRIRSKSVEVGTLDGEVLYDGTLQEGGRYSFVSHSGDIMVGVADGASAAFNIATLDGEVEATIPVQGMEHPTRRRTNFRLGTGSATVDVESFNGDVKVGRTGTFSIPHDNDDDN